MELVEKGVKTYGKGGEVRKKRKRKEKKEREKKKKKERKKPIPFREREGIQKTTQPHSQNL